MTGHPRDMTMTEQALPFLTGPVPGIGGVARAVPEDFRVEERPLYLPCGEGEHLYLRVTKRGLSTREMVSGFSSALGVKARCIGVAGLKDANAVTTQMVSVQGSSPELVSRLQKDSRILSVEVLGRHRNRLRTGHHAGNAFQIVIRDVYPSATSAVPLILEELSRRGVPNYFGPQRQGRDGLNYAVGASLLQDAARRAKMTRAKRLWFLHAYQSFLFNRILASRIDRLDRVLAGDWAMKHDNGACFLVEDGAVEQRRADAFEISPPARCSVRARPGHPASPARSSGPRSPHSAPRLSRCVRRRPPAGSAASAGPCACSWRSSPGH